MMSPEYPDAKAPDELAKGEAYQKKVAEELERQYGISIHYYTTKKDQIEKGESEEGYEIKYDDWIAKSKRISVEIAEKSRADLPEWTASGILRQDNTKFYVQGNAKAALVFQKEKLREYFMKNVRKLNVRKTIITFYINIDEAMKLADQIVKFMTPFTFRKDAK